MSMPFHSQGVFIFAALICVITDNYQCVDAEAICPSPIKGMLYLSPKPKQSSDWNSGNGR